MTATCPAGGSNARPERVARSDRRETRGRAGPAVRPATWLPARSAGIRRRSASNCSGSDRHAESLARYTWKASIDWARRSRLEPMRKVARVVREHLGGILNAVVSGAATALGESSKAKIEDMRFAALPSGATDLWIGSA